MKFFCPLWYRQVDKNTEARREIIPRFVAQNPKLRNCDAFFAAYGQCLRVLPEESNRSCIFGLPPLLSPRKALARWKLVVLYTKSIVCRNRVFSPRRGYLSNDGCAHNSWQNQDHPTQTPSIPLQKSNPLRRDNCTLPTKLHEGSNNKKTSSQRSLPVVCVEEDHFLSYDLLDLHGSR